MILIGPISLISQISSIGSMKKTLFLALCLIALSPISLMAESVSATDSRVTFVGRAMVENGAVRFD